MAKTTLEEITDKKIWEKFMASHPEANFLQSYNFGQLHQNLGKVIKRIGFFENNNLVGIMLCVVEKAKRATYLTVPGGPIIDWDNTQLVKLFKETIANIAKEENCS